MTNLIYAIKMNELKTSGLKVLYVKIGKTTNLKGVINTYSRGNDIEVLDLWESNDDLPLSQCESGVLSFAKKYALNKKGEKFIFLQDKYNELSDNVSKLLKKTSADKTKTEKIKKQKIEKESIYTGKKPYFVRLQNNAYKVDSWREVLESVARQIHDETDDFSKATKIRGRKRTYFTKNKKSSLKKSIKLPGTSYYYEGNVSANRIMKIIEELLTVHGYDKSDLEIEFE